MDAVATAKLALDASGMDRGLQSAGASVDKFAKQAGTALVGAFAFDKIISGFSTAIEKGDQLQDLANRFGVSAVSIQEIGNAASLSGGSVEDVAGAMNKLSKNAGEAIAGNETMAASFERIGLSVEDLKTMSPEALFMSLSKTLASGTIPQAEQLKLAMDLAGKSVGTLMETMLMGPEAISATGQAMGVMSAETIASLSEASDQIKIFQNTLNRGFASMVGPIMSLLKPFADLTAAVALFGVGLKEAFSGNVKEANAIFDQIKNVSKMRKEAEAKAKQKPSMPVPTAGGAAGNLSKADAKTVAAAEKDAIKDRTAEAMRMLAEEESERKLANASYERRRERASARMLEAANLEVQAAMEKQRMNKQQARMMAGPGGTSRQFQQIKGGAASETLDFASNLGDQGISDTINKERAKAAKEQQKINKEEFDAKVLESTSGTTAGGAQRTMVSRRQEFIKSEAGKEATGGKTLSDIYTVLNNALSKLVAAPMVN